MRTIAILFAACAIWSLCDEVKAGVVQLSALVRVMADRRCAP